MRAEVDQLKCRTVGECVKTCPDVFRFQEGSKRATVTADPIPPTWKARFVRLRGVALSMP
jgi:ferredoxin